MYSILVASLNENMKLANKLQKQLTELGCQSEIINLIELDFPMYSSAREEEGISLSVHKLVQKLEKSEGYIIVAPEYNYSIPPVLTNIVAWVTRVHSDFREYFKEKNILLATHSGGGGEDVLRDMRTQFSKLGAEVFQKEILITYKKALDENYSKELLSKFVALS